ncbi:cystine/glutamate transporter isoform X1 [Strongylocentrotus purpuratus]|uniref:Cystine/glutamate transporter n=1 Tax=Strongylocentrotus purpuratus TaxID=7668 RepID=A0A7M7N6G5_STRPU|nr:cystine/glutamate transporter isoform X1 [Strongylocentrotus purpuratus]
MVGCNHLIEADTMSQDEIRNRPDEMDEQASSSSSEPIVLGRNVGLPGCIGMVMGIIIGTGIFISPAGVLAGSGGSVGLSLVIWVICASIATCGAMCYTELSLTSGKSGGEFIFILEHFGPVLAFLRMWTILAIIMPCISAIQGITIANYLTTPFFSDCEHVPVDAIRLIAVVVIFGLVFINCVSVKWSSRLINTLTITKVIGLFVLIITGLVYICRGNTSNLTDAFDIPMDVNIPMAIYSGIFAFGGWESIAMIVEEIKNPERNVPLSIIISMVVITSIYLLANVAYLVILSPAQILASKAVAADFSVIALGTWSWTIWVFVALSAIGNLNAIFFGFSRVYYAAARDGLLPEVIGMINIRHRTPLPSVIVTVPIVMICLMVDDVFKLIQYQSFVMVAFQAITVCIIPYSRWKYPDLHRPFKVPVIIAVLFAVAMLFLMGLTLYTSPVSSGLGLLLTLIGVPIYFVFVRWNKPLWFRKITGSITRPFQKLFFVIPEEAKTQ